MGSSRFILKSGAGIKMLNMDPQQQQIVSSPDDSTSPISRFTLTSGTQQQTPPEQVTFMDTTESDLASPPAEPMNVEEDPVSPENLSRQLEESAGKSPSHLSNEVEYLEVFTPQTTTKKQKKTNRKKKTKIDSSQTREANLGIVNSENCVTLVVPWDGNPLMILNPRRRVRP